MSSENIDQRKHYRVKVQEGRILQVAVVAAKGSPPCPGTINDSIGDYIMRRQREILRRAAV